MKIPAIRAKMRNCIYCLATLSFGEIKKYIKIEYDELYQSKILRKIFEENILKSQNIFANYLETQEERFFNALILAVYDGQPIWNEIRLEEYLEEENYNLGVLTLSGEEKIFPVDGQHRVAGIKKAVENNPELALERVPVIFVGHSKDEIGMQRTRRMFSTLNRYAKPVSMRDIIALDEDDIVAIASRNLLDSTDLFTKERILDSKSKSIPDKNDTAITTIITYYECNKELLWLYIKDVDVYGINGEKISTRNKKVNEYIKHRPSDDVIEAFSNECCSFWETLMATCSEINSYENNSIGKYRDDNGGHVFFRPATLLPFTKAIVRIKEKTHKTYEVILSEFNQDMFWIQHKIWRKVLWDNIQKRMITGKGTLVEYLFLYMYDKDLLKPKELKKIEQELLSLWDAVDVEVFEHLDDIIKGY